jgi:hypothetical protein
VIDALTLGVATILWDERDIVALTLCVVSYERVIASLDMVNMISINSVHEKKPILGRVQYCIK